VREVGLPSVGVGGETSLELLSVEHVGDQVGTDLVVEQIADTPDGSDDYHQDDNGLELHVSPF
jgi:hypothetical protein